MHKSTLILSLLGIALLLASSVLIQPIKITAPENLTALQENTLVQFSGKVVKEIPIKKVYRITLDNNRSVECACLNFINHNISGTGTLERYKKEYIRVTNLIKTN